MEDEARNRDEMREALGAAERRAQALALELDELRVQLESTERARKAADTELHEATDRVAELSDANSSLVSSKRKLEVDIQTMRVNFSIYRLPFFNRCNSFTITILLPLPFFYHYYSFTILFTIS